MLKKAWKFTKIVFLLALVVAGGWGVHWFIKCGNDGGEGLFYVNSHDRSLVIHRTGPSGVRYEMYMAEAVYRLEMQPEDEHSQRVFPSYAEALRYGRKHQLRTMPSVSLVLASCSASDFRLQAALETALDADSLTGKPALLRRWLALVLAGRAQASESERDIYERAAAWLATAMVLAGDDPQLPGDLKHLAQNPPAAANDPPLGPWAESPRLAAIWRRDRFLARGIDVRDDTSAAVLAVLARTMMAHNRMAAAWQRQLVASRALHGRESGVTFEVVAERLGAVPAAKLTGQAVVEMVRGMIPAQESNDGRSNPAPAALSWVATPEETVLKPLGMKAWNDPMGELAKAVRTGRISLDPGPDGGFYRNRWFALETLAAPTKAPEAIKLQLSGDYQRRWQRAFAAGFTEGRSGFVKRMPIPVMGMKCEGDVPVDIAPEFSTEPAPVVYLRMARAYRVLERDLSNIMGRDTWLHVLDAEGQPLADDLRRRSVLLYGLTHKVYREVGFPMDLSEDEIAMDFTAAEKAADAWCASLESDPDVKRDARLLVTLLSETGASPFRCPAVLGVRLEPVKYDWAGRPLVGSEVKARFVPARYWLASPVTATLTVGAIPTPEEFRKRCESHKDVRDICAAFGETPPVLHSPARPWWPRLAEAVGVLGFGLLMLRWCRSRTKRVRRWLGAGMILGICGMILWVVYAPPLWVLRFVVARGAVSQTDIMVVTEKLLQRWAGERVVPLAMELLQKEDFQLRYFGAMVLMNHLSESYECSGDAALRYPYSATQLALLRSRIHDEIPEVARASWLELCNREEEIPCLINELEHCDESRYLDFRLRNLARTFPKRPDIVAVALKLAAHPRPDIRAAVLPPLANWKPPVPSTDDAVRSAACDPVASVREQAACAMGYPRYAGNPDVWNRLLDMSSDPDERVRKMAFTSVSRHVRSDYQTYMAVDSKAGWTDDAVQKLIVRHAKNPAAALDERMSAAKWIADPAALRASCRDMLPAVQRLPESVAEEGAPGMKRSEALALLVTRWVRADQYARALKDYRENSYDLAKHPELLNTLTQCIAENRSVAATEEVLREEYKQTENRDTVSGLMPGLMYGWKASKKHEPDH